MNAPHTYFSTEFRGNAGAIRSRLRNLFTAGKRRGTALALCALCAAALAGTLVACNTTPAEPSPAAGNPFGVPQAVYDYAEAEAGEQGKFNHLEESFTADHILDSGVLAVYRTHIGTKDFDPDATVLAGGRFIDDEGYLFEEWGDLLLFRLEDGTYTPLGHTHVMDESDQSAASAFLGPSDGSAADRLFALELLGWADEAFAPLIGAAPTEGEPWTDGDGVVWRRLSGFEKWNDALRVDDQVFGPLIWRFGRDKAVELMQTYVYVPNSVFLEKDGGLWVRDDAAELLAWHCTGDPDTLAVTSRTEDRIDFTMEGTDSGRAVTWTFTAQRPAEESGPADVGSYQFTRYYQLTAPLYQPDPADGKPQTIVEAVRAEMAAYAADLEAEGRGTEIVDSQLLELDLVRSLADVVEGYTLEAWRFDYRLKPADFHTVVLAGAMGVDEDGWLVDLYSMGEPCILALRDDAWNYTILGQDFWGDFSSTGFNHWIAQIVAGGAAERDLPLTERGWALVLPSYLELAEQLTEHYLDAAPDQEEIRSGYNYDLFSQELQGRLFGAWLEDPDGLRRALERDGGRDLTVTAIGPDAVSFTTPGGLPCTLSWNGAAWQFTQYGGM